MAATNNQLLRYIIRQNDLVLRGLSMVLDTVDFTLERTFEMADEVEDLVAAVAEETEVEKGTALIIDHAVSLLDDIKAKLDAAGTDKAKLKALSDSIRGNSTDLSAKKVELEAAVVRNTDVEPSAA